MSLAPISSTGSVSAAARPLPPPSPDRLPPSKVHQDHMRLQADQAENAAESTLKSDQAVLAEDQFKAAQNGGTLLTYL